MGSVSLRPGRTGCPAMEAEEGSKVGEGGIEGRILGAIRARIRDFKEQAE